MSNNHLTPNGIFPATLIIGPASNNLISDLTKQLGHPSLVNNPDVIVLDESTGWTIGSVRQIRLFFSQKPFSHQSRICIIQHPENLETPAQNAILKVLEEPGNNNYIIFASQIPGKLLPTILSRCHTISIKSDISANQFTPVPQSLNQRLSLSDKLGLDKTAVKPWLESELSTLQQLLIKKPESSTCANIRILIKAIDMVNHRVDPRAALDFYILSFV